MNLFCPNQSTRDGDGLSNPGLNPGHNVNVAFLMLWMGLNPQFCSSEAGRHATTWLKVLTTSITNIMKSITLSSFLHLHIFIHKLITSIRQGTTHSITSWIKQVYFSFTILRLHRNECFMAGQFAVISCSFPPLTIRAAPLAPIQLFHSAPAFNDPCR